MTKAQLVDENIKLRHHCEQLEAQLAQLNRAETKPTAKRGSVFEFNPSVKGDFMRASKLARECNGVVRRCAQ
jgi:hypothetical protein